LPLSMYHYWERQRTIRNASLIVFSMEVKCEETAPRVARLLLQLHHAMHKQQQVKAPTATTAPAQRERCMGSSSTDSRPSNPHSFSRKALPDGPISSGLPRRQPGNSKLHFASTRVRYARNPASSPSSPANSAWRPLFASLWRPSRPVLTARGPCVSPSTIALSPGSTRAAARDGRRLRAHRRCCYPVAGRPLARVGEAGRPRPFAGRCL